MAYLQTLAVHPAPTGLFLLVPAQRRETIWREVERRLRASDIEVVQEERRPAVYKQAATAVGPKIAVITWQSVLLAIEAVVDPSSPVAADVQQLHALCAAENENGFTPMSDELLTDLRLSRLVADLRKVLELAIDQCCSSDHLSTDGLRTGMSWERMGRDVRFGKETTAPGAWVGIEFSLWRKHGESPLWIGFPYSEFGQASSVEATVRSFLRARGLNVTRTDNWLFTALPLSTESEEATVVADLAESLRSLHQEIHALKE